MKSDSIYSHPGHLRVDERSFSIYNNILDSNRQNLSEDSLKRLNIMYFNYFNVN